MVSVESGTTDDVDAVADRWVELADGQREFGSHLLTAENRAAVRDAVTRSVVSDELLVARSERDGGIVGFVTFRVESDTYQRDVTRGLIQNIYVEPDRRGEGIGSELLKTAESALVEAGADVIALEVMADNDAARRFYRRHGYRTHRIELEKRAESDTLTKE